MRFRLAIGVALACSVCCAADDDSWFAFRAKKEGYKISFPGKPEVRSSQTVVKSQPILCKAVMWQGNGETLSVMTTILPGASTKNATASYFAGFIDSLTAKSNISIERMEDLSVGGHQAKHILAATPDHSASMEGYIFLKGSCGYAVMAVAPGPDGLSDPKVRKFFGSFDFLK